MKNVSLRGLFVVVGALVCSTLGIFAADTLRGVEGNLAQIGGALSKEGCPLNTIPFRSGTALLCVDIYEASPSHTCVHRSPVNTIQTEENTTDTDCRAVSVPDVSPWTYVSLTQAQRLCGGAGKRLPTPDEWYRIALGTDPETCAIREDGVQTTGHAGCVSGVGAHDLVGNVWEWVDTQVAQGIYEGRVLPETGYVTSVDVHGVALSTAGSADMLYGNDYFWSKSDGVFGVIRGGFYGSGDDAGLYAMNASVPTQFAAQGVGFRCVQDVL